MSIREKLLLVALIIWGSNIKVDFSPANAWIWWVLFALVVIAFLLPQGKKHKQE